MAHDSALLQTKFICHIILVVEEQQRLLENHFNIVNIFNTLRGFHILYGRVFVFVYYIYQGFIRDKGTGIRSPDSERDGTCVLIPTTGRERESSE